MPGSKITAELCLKLIDRLPNFAGIVDLSLDWRVLGFTFAIVLLTGVMFGLAPALKATRANLVAGLKDDSGSDRHRRRRLTLRNVLVEEDQAA